MSEQLNFQINIGGQDKVLTSLGEIKSELKDAEFKALALSQQFGETDSRVIQLREDIGKLRDALQDSAEASRNFAAGAGIFPQISKSIQGLAGGFAAVQGAIGLLGTESENVQKTLLRVQSALALSQGLQSIIESKDAFTNLNAAIQSTTVFQKANAAANYVTAASLKAMGVAAETTALSFRVLKTAIASTGILLAVVAIGELVAALMNYTSATEKAKKSQEELNKTILEGNKAALKASQDYLKTQNEIEVLRATATGKSEEEILSIKVKGIQNQINKNNEFYEILLKSDKKAAAELADNNGRLQDELTKLLIQGQIDRNKKLEEDAKKRKQLSDEEAKAEEQRIKERNDRESIAQQVQINAYRSTLSERQQELLQAEDDFEKKKGDLIRAGVTDFTLVQEEYRIKLAKINKKYDDDELKDKEDNEQKKLEAIYNNQARETQILELNAVSLQERRDAELAALSAQYQKEYDLAVKNGEDLTLLKELYAAKELSITRYYADEEKKAKKELEDAKFALASAGINLLGSLVGQNEKLSNAIFAIDKALAIAKIVKDTILEITANNAYGATLGPAGIGYAAPKNTLAKIRAATNIATIAATTIAKFKGGSAASNFGSGGAISTTGTPIVPTQQAQLTQLNQATINAIGNQAIRAYVVETDITSNQKRVQAIKQRARFS